MKATLLEQQAKALRISKSTSASCYYQSNNEVGYRYSSLKMCVDFFLLS
jgi:hypothetical protein